MELVTQPRPRGDPGLSEKNPSVTSLSSIPTKRKGRRETEQPPPPPPTAAGRPHSPQQLTASTAAA